MIAFPLPASFPAICARLCLLLADGAAKGLAAIAGAALIALVWRNRDAATRHMAWAWALCGLLALPLISQFMPQRSLPWLPSPAGPPAAAAAASLTPASPLQHQGAAIPGSPSSASSDEPAQGPRSAISMPAILVAIWLLGAALAFVPLLAGQWRARRRLRGAERLGDEAILGEVGTLCATLRLGWRPAILLGDGGTMPTVVGMWRPALWLPRDIAGWPELKRRAVLLHALAHVRRRDGLTQAVARLACALHWFNPLAWWALRRLRLESERACDDLVIASGVPAPDYAECVLAVARTLLPPPSGGPGAIAMARRDHLDDRLLSIFDGSHSRRPIGAGPHAAVLTLALLAFIGLAVTRLSVAGRPGEVQRPPARTMREDNQTIRRIDADGSPLPPAEALGLIQSLRTQQDRIRTLKLSGRHYIGFAHPQVGHVGVKYRRAAAAQAGAAGAANAGAVPSTLVYDLVSSFMDYRTGALYRRHLLSSLNPRYEFFMNMPLPNTSDTERRLLAEFHADLDQSKLRKEGPADEGVVELYPTGTFVPSRIPFTAGPGGVEFFSQLALADPAPAAKRLGNLILIRGFSPGRRASEQFVTALVLQLPAGGYRIESLRYGDREHTVWSSETFDHWVTLKPGLEFPKSLTMLGDASGVSAWQFAIDADRVEVNIDFPPESLEIAAIPEHTAIDMRTDPADPSRSVDRVTLDQPIATLEALKLFAGDVSPARATPPPAAASSSAATVQTISNSPAAAIPPDSKTTASLLWGTPLNGLRAALELIPAQNEYAFGQRLGVRFHIQNVGRTTKRLSLEEMSSFPALIQDPTGMNRELPSAIYLGWDLFKDRSLKPGEIAILYNHALGLGPNSKGDALNNPTVGVTLDGSPGKYRIAYKLTLKGAGEIETGPIEIAIAHAP